MSGQSSKRHPIVLQYTLRYFLNKKKTKWLWGNLTFYHVLNKIRRKEKGNKNDSSIYAREGFNSAKGSNDLLKSFWPFAMVLNGKRETNEEHEAL